MKKESFELLEGLDFFQLPNSSRFLGILGFLGLLENLESHKMLGRIESLQFHFFSKTADLNRREWFGTLRNTWKTRIPWIAWITQKRGSCKFLGQTGFVEFVDFFPILDSPWLLELLRISAC
jgi:hypothetical protein